MNHYCCSELLYGTIGTDSMAELKEEDSHTAATATQLPTAATATQLPTAATATQLPTAAQWRRKQKTIKGA